LISLAVYRSGRKWLPPETVRARTHSAARQPFTRDERKALWVLILILPVMAIAAVANQEVFNAYLLWVPENIDLTFFGHTLPTTWLVTVDAVMSIGCLAGAVAFWRLWASRYREPSEIVKIALGTAIATLGQLTLAGAALASAGGHKAGPGWIVAFEFLNSAGFANMFPVGLALFARASPKAVAGTMIGVYYGHLFLANTMVGWLGGLVERLPGPQFWLLHAALVGGAALLLALAAALFGRLLAPSREQATS
jgi:POT family proton-dependent oligopeptide transporter